MSKMHITVSGIPLDGRPVGNVQLGDNNTMHVGHGRGLADLDSEHLQAQADAFVRYVRDHINPARADVGLDQIDQTQARLLFRVAVDWDKNLRGLPHFLDLP